MVQVAVTDLAAYFDDEITAMPNLTSVGTLTTLTVDNIIINGTNIGHTSDTDAIAIASDGNVTVSQNLTVTGDLTVSGDDITMGTNTAGHLLIADGTNFNSVSITSLSEISTAASDDVLLAVDTSGGGLKKIARSTVVAGLATDSAISNVVEDTSPQLGGNLDTNSQNILIDDAHFIADENGNEQIIFQTTSSAVNQFDVTNAATGNPPSIQATGGDSNIDFNIGAKGTGHVTVLGNTNPGTIQFNCEQNSHGVQLKGPAHSASSSAVLTLPTATGNIIGSGDTGTLPVAAIDIDGATDIGAAIVDADLFIIDDGAGGTNRKVTASRLKTYAQTGVSSAADDITAGDAAVTIATTSGNITIDAQAGDTDIIFKGTDSSSDITALTLDMSAAGEAIFNAGIVIADAGNIGSASDKDAIAISSGGVVTMNQIPVFSAGINVSGGSIAGTLSTAAQTNITSLGTLTTLTVDNVITNGTTIGHTDDTDLITLADGIVTVAGEISVTTLDIGGTNVTSTAAELNLLDGVSGLVQADLTKLAAVDSTAAELNIVDGGTSATSTTVADADRVVLNDNGTMVQVAMTDIKTYIGGGTSWQAVKTSNFTASAGQGVFCNTTSAAFTLTLPAGSIGDEVTFVDYAGTFDTNNLTIAANGSEKIHGSTDDLTVSVERAANTLVFTDSTQGWLLKSK